MDFAGVTSITNDSRKVQPGSLFLAVAGEQFDGRQFIAQAVAAGAVAVVYEAKGASPQQWEVDVPCVAVENLQAQQGRIAAEFYRFPSRHLTMIGVTGTNGKTSVTQFIAQAMAEHPCGVIGTVGYGFLPQLQMGQLTTPDPVSLQSMLAELCEDGAMACAMEVSSHALVQGRVAAVEFDIAVFTQLSRDHLDYHGTMEAYGEAKAQLFASPGLRYGVINCDDPLGRTLIERHQQDYHIIPYSSQQQNYCEMPGIYVTNCQALTHGFIVDVVTPWGSGQFTTQLLGRFNVDNLLATLGVLGAMEVPLVQALKAISRITTVPGRMQAFGGGKKPTVIVDYAHTPDALEKALTVLRAHCQGKLWCIYGCGGDRDKGKRPQMGAIAEQFADQPIITNDNPRSEVPADIANDIQAGLANPAKTVVLLDREEAITYAVQSASPGDIVLVAGKGHEMTQTIGDRIQRFSDAEIVESLLV